MSKWWWAQTLIVAACVVFFIVNGPWWAALFVSAPLLIFIGAFLAIFLRDRRSPRS